MARGTLTSLDAAVILVAHDRWFLEAVATAVLELEAGRSLFFRGPWHEWRREKAARAIAAGKTVARHEVDIARLERFVERFRYKKNKARQAQAKLTQIARLEKERSRAAGELDSLTKRSKSLGFDFLNPPRSGRTVVSVEGLDVAAGDKPLLHDVTFAIDRGEHVGLVGPTGRARRPCSRPPRRPVRLRRDPRVLLAAGNRARRARQRARLRAARHRPPTTASPDAPRPLPLLRLGHARAAGDGAVRRGAPAPVARAARRLGGELPRARRADEPSRPREPRGARGGARGVPGNGAARLPRPCGARRRRAPNARDRGRHGALVRRRLGRLRPPLVRKSHVQGTDPGTVSESVARTKRGRDAGASAKRPRAIVELEAEIETKEVEVAELERRLADDWANVDTTAAYRHAREELEALLARWELLFDQTSA